jgi:hypothetical protein
MYATSTAPPHICDMKMPVENETVQWRLTFEENM